MTKTYKLFVNVDLPRAAGDALISEITSHSVENDVVCTGDREFANAAQSVTSADKLQVYLFVTRRNAHDLNGIDAAHAKLSNIGEELMSLGLSQAIDDVFLVDAGERPCAPLSDMSVLGQHMECIAGNISAMAKGLIFALEYNVTYSETFALQVSELRIMDTRDPEFVSYNTDYLIEMLRNLNSNFGQGILPKVNPLASVNLEEAIDRAVRKLVESST